MILLVPTIQDIDEMRQLLALRCPVAPVLGTDVLNESTCVVIDHLLEISDCTQLAQHDANLTSCFAFGHNLNICNSAR